MRPAVSLAALASEAIEAEGLCRRYGRRWALVDVSVRLPRGAGLLVAGRNGSGKSTLLRVLATAIRADRGGGQVLGHDLRHDAAGVRRGVALLSHASYLYELLSALENLRITARFLGKDTRAAWPSAPPTRPSRSRRGCASAWRWPASCSRTPSW